MIVEYPPLKKAVIDSDPKIPRPGREGYGQCLEYDGTSYYYRNPKWVPKNKVVHLTYEGCYLGRQHGDKEYIVVAWDGKDFIVLESIDRDLKKTLAQYKGLTPLEAIAKKQQWIDDLNEKRRKEPKCRICKTNPLLALYDEQPNDVCCECFRPSKKK